MAEQYDPYRLNGGTASNLEAESTKTEESAALLGVSSYTTEKVRLRRAVASGQNGADDMNVDASVDHDGPNGHGKRDPLRKKIIRLLRAQLNTQLQENEARLRENKAQQARIDALELALKNLTASKTPIPPSPATPAIKDGYQMLPDDTFSFMIISQPCSKPMNFSIAIFATQIILFGLVAGNVLDPTRSSENPLGIPANVDYAVRLTQLVAIVISVVTQADIRTAMLLLNDGYHADSFDSSFGKGAVSKWKWVFSILCRIAEGSLGLVVTFFLIVQAETVVDLLLNFTAMEFVSHLDELAFLVGLQGFAGISNQETARTIKSTAYETRGADKTQRGRMALLIILLTAFLIGWGIVAQNQSSGAYFCSVLHAQFSDELDPSMGAFSGLYDRQLPGWFREGSVIYLERKSEGKAKFAYCRRLRAWTFTFDDNRNGGASKDPCNWKAKSSETISYDITTTDSSDWVVRTNARQGPLQFFRISCYDCHKRDRMDEVCRGRGKCINNACHCDQGSYGLRCEFEQPCPTLEIDARLSEFQGTRQWSTTYEILGGANNAGVVQVYDRPVYISPYRNGNFELFLYSGRRWVLTDTALLGMETQKLDPEDLKQELKTHLEKFHAHNSYYSVAFISQPMDVDTPTDAATPVGLEWFRKKDSLAGRQEGAPVVDANRQVDVVLLCSLCDNSTNQCLFQGQCNINGTCTCTTGSSGVLCQVAPLGNGRCDPKIFNEAEYSYDDGDCCPQTCVSTEANICGKDQTGYTDVGYFFCHLASNSWVPNGQNVTSISGRKGRSGSSVALSSTGTILVVGEPTGHLIRVFDKDGSNWVQRGRVLEGPSNLGFGEQIAMSSGLPTAASTPSIPIQFVLVVGLMNGVRVFNCLPQGCNQFGDDIIVDGSLMTGSPIFAISGNGIVIAMTDTSIDRVHLFTFQESSGKWEKIDFVPLPRNWDGDVALRNDPGLYLSFSRSGDALAVGTWVGERYPGILSVQVHKRVNSPGSLSLCCWKPIGSPIRSHKHGKFDGPSRPLPLVRLSDDGMVLAIGSNYPQQANSTSTPVPGVHVFRWEGEDWKNQGIIWVIGGTNFAGLNGLSIDLSSDGSTIAVSSPLGRILVFEWNGKDYQQKGDSIEVGSPSAMSLSGDGSALAVGLPEFSNGIDGGITTVYSFHRVCKDNESLIRVSLTMGDCSYGHLITWEILNSTSGEGVLRGGPFPGGDDVQEFTTFVDQICLDVEKDCFAFNIYHVGECQINPPAGYRILVDGEVRFSGGDTWKHGVKRHHLGNCQECQLGHSHLQAIFRGIQPMYYFGHSEGGYLSNLVWDFHDSNRTIGEGHPYLQHQISAIEDFCIPNLSECYTISLFGWPGCKAGVTSGPVMDIGIYLDGTLVGNETNQHVTCAWRSQHSVGSCGALDSAREMLLGCGTGLAPLLVNVLSSSDPTSLSWTVSSCSNETIMKTELYDNVSMVETCVPTEDCSFVISFEYQAMKAWNGSHYIESSLDPTYTVDWSVSLGRDKDLTANGVSELERQYGEDYEDMVSVRFIASEAIAFRNCTVTCSQLMVSSSEESVEGSAAGEMEKVVVPSMLRFRIFPAFRGPRRDPLESEVVRVLAASDQFYAAEFSKAYGNFESFEALLVNTSRYQLPLVSSSHASGVRIDFDAKVTFRGRAPTFFDVVGIMACADYVEYLHQHVWTAGRWEGPLGSNLFYYTEWAGYDHNLNNGEADWESVYQCGSTMAP